MEKEYYENFRLNETLALRKNPGEGKERKNLSSLIIKRNSITSAIKWKFSDSRI